MSARSRVLHIGCDRGDLLAAVRPAYGIGIDSNPEAIALFQNDILTAFFILANCLIFNSTKLRLCSDSQFHRRLQDIQQVLERIRALTHEGTWIVITIIIICGGHFAISARPAGGRPNNYQNWLLPEDIANLLELRILTLSAVKVSCFCQTYPIVILDM
jgi:hypothetical protein